MDRITKRITEKEITSGHLSRETGMGGFLHLIYHKNPENNSNCRIRSSSWNTKPSAILLFILLQLFLVASASAFQVGDKIQATTRLNVRSCYFLTCDPPLGTVSAGNTGTIINGSYIGDGYTWWYIGWDNGLRGYSVEGGLGSVALPTPTISSISPSTITQGTSYQNITVYGSNFTSSSYHQYSVSGGSSWAWATSAPTINSSTSMTIGVNNTAVQTIYFRVCASYGSTACSVSVAVTIQAASPASPTGFRALASNGIISLAWNDNSNNETGFKIERKVGASGSWSQLVTTGQGIAAYRDYGVTAGTTYYYRVYAYNTSGNSAYSNTASASPPAPVTPPTANTGICQVNGKRKIMSTLYKLQLHASCKWV